LHFTNAMASCFFEVGCGSDVIYIGLQADKAEQPTATQAKQPTTTETEKIDWTCGFTSADNPLDELKGKLYRPFFSFTNLLATKYFVFGDYVTKLKEMEEEASQKKSEISEIAQEIMAIQQERAENMSRLEATKKRLKRVWNEANEQFHKLTTERYARSFAQRIAPLQQKLQPLQARYQESERAIKAYRDRHQNVKHVQLSDQDEVYETPGFFDSQSLDWAGSPLRTLISDLFSGLVVSEEPSYELKDRLRVLPASMWVNGEYVGPCYILEEDPSIHGMSDNSPLICD
jgi:hypothetical protein